MSKTYITAPAAPEHHCPLSYEQFCQMVTFLHEHQAQNKQYLDALPNQLSEVLVTNPFAESIHIQLDAVCKALFAQHWPDVEWFLNEWRPGYNIELQAQEGKPAKTYVLNSLADYLSYAKECLF